MVVSIGAVEGGENPIKLLIIDMLQYHLAVEIQVDSKVDNRGKLSDTFPQQDDVPGLTLACPHCFPQPRLL
jgi:hypothetical protein